MGVCRLQSQLTRPHSLSVSRNHQPKFDTIASACMLGIGLDNFIAMPRMARTSDSGAARFLDAWDALGETEQLSASTADAVREKLAHMLQSRLLSQSQKTLKMLAMKSKMPTSRCLLPTLTLS